MDFYLDCMLHMICCHLYKRFKMSNVLLSLWEVIRFIPQKPVCTWVHWDVLQPESAHEPAVHLQAVLANKDSPVHSSSDIKGFSQVQSSNLNFKALNKISYFFSKILLKCHSADNLATNIAEHTAVILKRAELICVVC